MRKPDNDLTGKAYDEIKRQYDALEANMDRADIPVDTYGRIRSSVIRNLERDNPGLTVNEAALRRWGI